jgi:hypothetical protein
MNIIWGEEQDAKIVDIAKLAKRENRDYILEFKKLSRLWNVEKSSIVSRWFYLASLHKKGGKPFKITPQEFIKKPTTEKIDDIICRKDEDDLASDYIRSDNLKSDPWKDWEDKILLDLTKDSTDIGTLRKVVDVLTEKGSVRTISACKRRHSRITNGRISWSDEENELLVDTVINAIIHGEDLNEVYLQIEEVFQVDWNKCRLQFYNLKRLNESIEKRYQYAIKIAENNGFPLPRRGKRAKKVEKQITINSSVDNKDLSKENRQLKSNIKHLEEKINSLESMIFGIQLKIRDIELKYNN